jgi:hypothetical protein
MEIQLFPRYENEYPMPLTSIPWFFEKRFDSFLESLTEKPYPLNKMSTNLSVPYGEKNYVIRICVDIETKHYSLSVEIPYTDMFLPIKNDIHSVQRAIYHIMADNIPLYNSDAHQDVDYDVHEYIRI